MKTNFFKSFIIIAGILFSGLCWYLSNGLTGKFWYLLWIAPVPVLLISFQSTAKQTFIFAFVAYLVGRLSWFSYLVTVATLIPAIVFTLAFPLAFAGIMLLTRRAVLRINTWYAVFAFPVFFTAFECLLMKFSPDGSATSIAYSQSDFLPLIQLASLTGIAGITFVITFVPAALALYRHFRHEKRKQRPLLIMTLVLITLIATYAWIRLNQQSDVQKTRIGLVVLDEKTHHLHNIDFRQELEHIRNYASEISRIALQGAEWFVLPERAMNINHETDTAALGILSDCARQHGIWIVAGYTNYRHETQHNSAVVIDHQGNVVMDYDKVHLVRGLENHFTPGTEAGIFRFKGSNAGIAICKDLDFPDYVGQYSRNEAAFLCIPAWDFVVDDWLHSRMAIMRGVENGFPELRTARLGRLTISDPFGRVIAEASCTHGKASDLTGEISLNSVQTFYARYRNWFCWVVITAALAFVIAAAVKREE